MTSKNRNALESIGEIIVSSVYLLGGVLGAVTAALHAADGPGLYFLPVTLTVAGLGVWMWVSTLRTLFRITVTQIVTIAFGIVLFAAGVAGVLSPLLFGVASLPALVVAVALTAVALLVVFVTIHDIKKAQPAKRRASFV